MRVHQPVIAALVLLLAQPAHAATVIKTLRHEKAGAYTIEIKYPQFTEATPVARLANRTIDVWVRADVADFLKAAREAMAARQRLPGPYEYSGESRVTHARPARLISVLLDIDKFTGGAHGTAWYVPFNFGVIDGKPKRLVLGDLFRPNSGHQRLVSNAVIAKLQKEEGATWVREGQMKSLSVDQLNRFSITPPGFGLLVQLL